MILFKWKRGEGYYNEVNGRKTIIDHPIDDLMPRIDMVNGQNLAIRDQVYFDLQEIAW